MEINQRRPPMVVLIDYLNNALNIQLQEGDPNDPDEWEIPAETEQGTIEEVEGPKVNGVGAQRYNENNLQKFMDQLHGVGNDHEEHKFSTEKFLPICLGAITCLSLKRYDKL